jgi:two-component sensor histidine kinase
MSETVLIVDDEAMTAQAVAEMLTEDGYRSEYRLTAEQAIQEVASGGVFDLVLMDIWFGPAHMDGGEAAKRIGTQFGIPVLFITGYDDETTLSRTEGSGAYGIVQKSVGNFEVLRRAVRLVIQRHEAFVGLQHGLARAENATRETNHRVKNSFAVLASLVRLQTSRDRSRDPREFGQLITAQLAAFQHLHELLQETPLENRVRLRTFLERVVSAVFPSWPDFEVDVTTVGEDPLLSGRRATPIGLIAAEIAMNSAKHCFAPGRENEFRTIVTLKPEADKLILEFTDNGPPLSPDALTEKASTGTHLMGALVRQIGGELEVRRTPSPTYRLEVPFEER